MITTIIFDLGGVLFTNGTAKFIKDVSAKYNIDTQAVKNIMDGGIGSAYREGKINRLEFWQQVKDLLPLTEDIDTLECQWISGYELIEGTRDLVQELKTKYKVYYLSDNVRERVDQINSRYNFLSWFDGGVFSHEAGVRKPSPQIYLQTLTKAECEAQDAVYIDDKPEFVLPAQQLGLTGLVFTTPEKLRTDLLSLNLL